MNEVERREWIHHAIPGCVLPVSVNPVDQWVWYQRLCWSTAGIIGSFWTVLLLSFINRMNSIKGKGIANINMKIIDYRNILKIINR